MNNIYEMCERLIMNGRASGMQYRIDKLKRSGRLTGEEYKVLNEMLNPQGSEEEKQTEDVT